MDDHGNEPEGKNEGADKRSPDRYDEDRYGEGIDDRDLDQYIEMTNLLQRLYRRYLDVIRLELETLGIRDINSLQALMLFQIKEEEMTVRDLMQRCYHLGSSTNYNLKKLVDYGYLEQERSTHDKRSIRVRLSDKGREIVTNLRQVERRHATELFEDLDDPRGIKQARRTLRAIERIWADFIDFG